MRAEHFLKVINEAGIEYFSGVPDSQLSAFMDAVVNRYGTGDPKHHVVAVNEGCAVGLAAGYHLATGKTPCIYMQNSGLGNAVNPITSLLHREVYGIGCLFVIGYRGQLGIKDEPQHVFMGKVTLPLLELLDISYLTLGEDTTEAEFCEAFNSLKSRLLEGQSVAIVVKKNALTVEKKPNYKNEYTLNRENVVDAIASLVSPCDVIVSTTGKISRELYEARKRQGKSGGEDFLTVGSMGHCSSIALGIAAQKPEKRLIVLDGDGALLMHMGALATIGAQRPNNFVHLLLDNSSHETVGGMPTVSSSADICSVARSLGYALALEIDPKLTIEELNTALSDVLKKQTNGAIFVRIPVAIGSRSDLLRPKEKPSENKLCFMNGLNK